MIAVCGLVLCAGDAVAEDKMPLELKIVVKKETVAWPYELGPKEFEAKLNQGIKNKERNLPKPPAVDLVLTITNTSKEKMTIHVEGDANTLTLTLKGPGVVTANTGGAFTTDFRFPRSVDLEAGKSFEIPVKSLADGFRRASRYLYPTAPGDYTITATYQLATADGGKGAVLKSGEAKLTIAAPK
jgi:hypothetical protein